VTTFLPRVSSAIAPLLAIFICTACHSGRYQREAHELTGGDPGRGRIALQKYGCNTCHTIPGVPLDATVGPPLLRIAQRTYLAGRLQNTPQNLMTWIRNPRAIDPLTAMPATGVSINDARDIAAYLYTLR
jgi:cytochrome c